MGVQIKVRELSSYIIDVLVKYKLSQKITEFTREKL